MMNKLLHLLIGVTFLWHTIYAQEKPVNPFATNDGLIPSSKEYHGSLFQFNYDYPTNYYPPQSTPWSDVLKGQPLTKKNATKDMFLKWKTYRNLHKH